MPEELSFYYQGYELSQETDAEGFATLFATLPDQAARREFTLGHMHAAIDTIAKQTKAYVENHIDDQYVFSVAIWLSVAKANFR